MNDLRTVDTKPAPEPSPYQDYDEALEKLVYCANGLRFVTDREHRDHLIDRAAHAVMVMQMLKEFL